MLFRKVFPWPNLRLILHSQQCLFFTLSPLFDWFFFVTTVALEELCEDFEYRAKYNAVIASEVIEHINALDTFIDNKRKLIKICC